MKDEMNLVQSTQAVDSQAETELQDAVTPDSKASPELLRNVPSKTFTEEQLRNGRKWVDALRSGKYQQGRARLRKFDNTFCCLGVACDIVAPDEWVRGEWCYHFLNERNALPISVQNQFGVDCAGRTSPNTPFKNLADLNDSGQTFLEIADIIEREIYHGLLPPSEQSEDLPAADLSGSENLSTASTNNTGGDL